MTPRNDIRTLSGLRFASNESWLSNRPWEVIEP